MTIDIDKLRAAHAATTQGVGWSVEREPSDLTHSVWVDTDSLVAEYNTEADADFFVLAHNEFPAVLDEIERMREELRVMNLRLRTACETGENQPLVDDIERFRLECVAARHEADGANHKMTKANKQTERLRTALTRSLTALNTAPNFSIPSLGINSYKLASEITEVLK